MRNHSLAAAERLMKKQGIERVSEEAKEKLCAIMEAHGILEIKKALLMMKHAGRKTVKAKDFEVL